MTRYIDELRYGFRALLHRPRFTALVVLTLALGIGAATSIFSVIDAVLLEPLPYAQSSRLVRLRSIHRGDRVRQRASYPDFVDWRAQSRSLDLVGYGSLETVLIGSGDPQRLSAELFVGDLFRLLGVPPTLGSGSFEARPGEPTVVLSDDLWHRRFSANPGIVGTPITLDGITYLVAAVMPPGFEFPVRAETPADLWIPLERFNPALAARRGARLIDVIGRLRPGFTSDQAQAEMDVIAARLSERYPDTNAAIHVELTPAREQATGGTARGLLFVAAGVAALLSIACVNAANLLLTRSVERRREVAIRAALGASRARIARELLIESTLVAWLGGALGCLLAFGGVAALGPWLAGTVPRAGAIAVNGHVLAFTMALSGAIGILFGLVPAWHAARADSAESLQGGAGQASLTLSTRRLGDALVVAEVALAVLLLTSAGLFIHSFAKLNRPAPGFDPHNVLTFELTWPSEKYARPADAFRELRQHLLHIPLVVAASTGLQLPNRGQAALDDTSPFVDIEGQPTAPAERLRASTVKVQPSYFRALGIPLSVGRDFSDDDDADHPRVVIVNEALARAYFGARDPTGQRLRLDSWTLLGGGAATIVGVAGDVKQPGFGGEAEPVVYLPIAQWPTWHSVVLVRVAGNPFAAVPAVREAVRAMDPNEPIDELRTLEQRLAHELANDRFRALLLGAFAALGALLAAFGIYGVVSYTTAQRTHEIAIRIALGAERRGVVRAVAAYTMLRVATGTFIGVAAAVLSGRIMRDLLFDVGPVDPAALAAVALIVVLAMLPACVIPARRAARANAIAALKSQ